MTACRLKYGALLGLLLSLTAIFTMGCGAHTDKIVDLNDNPGKYLNQSVTIAGQVTQVFGMPLGISNLAAYRIGDGTGQIWVITHDGPPNPGVKLGVKGVLKSVGDLHLGALGNPFGNVVQESDRQPLQQ